MDSKVKKAEVIDADAIRIGKRIAQIMARQEISTRQLASDLNYTESGVRAVLSGRNAQFLIKTKEWCRALGVTPNVILGFESEAALAPPQQGGIDEYLVRAAVEGMLLDLGLPEEEAVDAARGVVATAREESVEGVDRQLSARVAAVARLRDSRKK